MASGMVTKLLLDVAIIMRDVDVWKRRCVVFVCVVKPLLREHFVAIPM